MDKSGRPHKSVWATPGSSPAPHFRVRVPLLGAAFAGGGLNLKRTCDALPRARPSRPLQSLDGRHVTGASLRIAHCSIRVRFYHPRGHYPRCCTARFRGGRGSTGFRAFPNSLGESRHLFPGGGRGTPLGFEQAPYLQSWLGTLSGSRRLRTNEPLGRRASVTRWLTLLRLHLPLNDSV